MLPRPPAITLSSVADLSLTALCTSAVWARAKLPCAELCATEDAARVLAMTNAALVLARKPKLDVALLQRHAMLDYLARDVQPTHVVELAAGLSPRGAAMTLGTAIGYVEVDLPPMIAKKRELFARSAEGRAALERVTLVAADVAEVDVAALVAPPRTLVIVEGLCMYLTRDARASLFARIARAATACGELHLAFDLTPEVEEPAPGLAGKLLAAIMARATGGARFVRDARTRADVLDELRAAGFSEARAISAREVAHAWQLPHADRETPTVTFVASARGTRP
jgi:O-methyltransferase involved in polyketide biosynthesis